MNRYTLLIKLDNGNEVHAKSVGDNEQDAIQRVVNNIEFKEFVGGCKYSVSVVDCEKCEYIPYEACKTLLDGSKRILIHIKSGLTFTWTEGKFNETCTMVNNLDRTRFPSQELATILREVGEWVSIYVEGN